MLVSTAAFGLAALRAGNRGDVVETRARFILAATLSLLSLLLLIKIWLRARAAHYGFALAMPATLVLIVLVWDWVPRVLARVIRHDRIDAADIGDAGAALRGAFLAMLLFFVGMHLARTSAFLAAKRVRVATAATRSGRMHAARRSVRCSRRSSRSFPRTRPSTCFPRA